MTDLTLNDFIRAFNTNLRGDTVFMRDPAPVHDALTRWARERGATPALTAVLRAQLAALRDGANFLP